MREVRTSVWHWEASHLEWKPNAGWGKVVSSYAIDDSDRLSLFDPSHERGGCVHQIGASSLTGAA